MPDARMDGQDSGPVADELRRLNGMANRHLDMAALRAAMGGHVDAIVRVAEIHGAARALRAVADDTVTGWAIGTWLRLVADLVEDGVQIEDAIRQQNDHDRRDT